MPIRPLHTEPQTQTYVSTWSTLEVGMSGSLWVHPGPIQQQGPREGLLSMDRTPIQGARGLSSLEQHRVPTLPPGQASP